MPVVGFWDGKSLKDYLVRARLPKLVESGRCEPCGKKTCLVCDSISSITTFTTEACKKLRKAPWISTPKKYYIYWNAKSLAASSTLGKKKLNFAADWTITTVNIEHLEKVTKKFLRNAFTLTIVSMATLELMIRILWLWTMWNTWAVKRKRVKRRSTYINIRIYLSYSLRLQLIWNYTFLPFSLSLPSVYFIYSIIYLFSYV